MHLEQSIVIRRNPNEVWRFLGSVPNVALWDRGVARTQTTKDSSQWAVGLEFDNFASQSTDRGKMSYRIVESGPDHCAIQLISSTGNARFFRSALWAFRTQPHPEGTLLICAVDFETRLRYRILAPLLYIKRSAILIDLECLKHAIEDGKPASH